MILKASQRAGAAQLAIHLLRDDHNDHVEVHEVRGFAADDIKGALREAYAISRATKCRQYLFSVSLSPPETEWVNVRTFERAIDELETRVGLKGQPRVVVFHEKNGRRHAHCVWSRIKVDELKAVNLPHYQMMLRDLSRELYLTHGWTMPRGLAKSEERNPLNFSREEWQQAKRVGRDVAAIKQAFQDAWAISDSLTSFRNALEARGFYLARGDRRAFVALSVDGEVYAIARWTGQKTKAVVARLGDPDHLPSAARLQAELAARVSDKIAALALEAQISFENARLGLASKRKALVAWQRDERHFLAEFQAARWVAETRERLARFRTGLKGLWDRVTGYHSTVRRQNEVEAQHAIERDRRERQALIERHLRECGDLQREARSLAKGIEAELSSLRLQPRQAQRPATSKSPIVHGGRQRRADGPRLG